jgi:ectoine hydroxylase-related dioxygenase (phytanoyl-CoA dioxygenase family)
LFEHDNCLPAHYINAFTPGCYHDDLRVGGTAFVHGSHQLSFTAKYTPTTASYNNTAATTNTTALKEEMYAKFLVRPQLQPGDVLLFDCRVLHFGLANRGEEARPLMYTNMTHSWFHDPKNWDDRQAIFDERPKRADVRNFGGTFRLN